MEVAEEDEQQNTNDTIPMTASSEPPSTVQLGRNEYLRQWQLGLPSATTHTTSNGRQHNHLSCSPSSDILDVDADDSVAFLPSCSRDPPSPPATIGALDRDDCSSPVDNVTQHQPSWTSSFPIRPSSRYASPTLQDNVAIPPTGQAPAWSRPRMQPRVRRPIQIRSQSTCNVCNAILGRDAIYRACGHALNVTPSSATSQPITRYTSPSTMMNTRQELGNYDILPLRDQYPLHAEIPAVLTLVSNEGHLEWSEFEPGSGNPEEHEAEEMERALQTLRMKMRKTSDQIRRMDSDRERYTALQKCHKCCTSFLRTAPDMCLRCRHVRCAQCSQPPSLKHKSSKIDLEQGGLAQKVSGDAIRRVYRRPRLRVRYTCDHCGTPFTVAPVCIECGHHRCGSCFRNPPRAPILAHGLPGQITTTLLALERLAADAGRTRSSHSDRDEFLDTG